MSTNHVDVYVHCDVDGLPLDVYLTYAEASAAQAKWTRSSSIKRVPLHATPEHMCDGMCSCLSTSDLDMYIKVPVSS